MRYYCHHCHSQIERESLLPDFTCPNCQTGFIEEITISQASVRDDGPGSSRMSSDEYSDDISDAEFMEAPLSHLISFYGTRLPGTAGQQQGNTSTATASTNTSAGTPQTASTSAEPNVPRYLIRTAVRGGQQRLEEPTLGDVLADFINSASFGTRLSNPDGTPINASQGGQNPAGRGLINIDLPLPFFLHSSPGDYAWGNAGFDAIVTQLLNNLDGTSSGPPPMPKEQIDKLPTVTISEEQSKKQGLQCTVCMEDFQVGETARQLPCEHSFHQVCIIPWLELHASCPICRKTFLPGSTGSQQRTNQTSNTNLDNNPPTSVTAPNPAHNYDYTEDDCD